MKKIFSVILLLIVSLLLTSTICFAENTNFGTEMQDSANKTGESMQNVRNGVMDFANDVGNGIKNTAEDVGNTMQGMFNGDNPNTTTGSNYNASRTSADVVGNVGPANTVWIWLILGITGIIIVALTWYYVSQDDRHGAR